MVEGRWLAPDRGLRVFIGLQYEPACENIELRKQAFKSGTEYFRSPGVPRPMGKGNIDAYWLRGNPKGEGESRGKKTSDYEVNSVVFEVFSNRKKVRDNSDKSSGQNLLSLLSKEENKLGKPKLFSKISA